MDLNITKQELKTSAELTFYVIIVIVIAYFIFKQLPYYFWKKWSLGIPGI